MGKLAPLCLLACASAALAGDLPNLELTPGVTRPLSLAEICTTKWGKDGRAVTEHMKRQVFSAYGFTGNDDPKCDNPGSRQRCEVDHLISRELGGADDVRNLWIQRYAGTCNAHDKDRLENKLHRMVCARPPATELGVAQQALVGNWIEAFTQYVDPAGCGDDPQ